MHHLGLNLVGVTVQDLLLVVDDTEIGEKCGNNRFLEGFEVVGFPKQSYHKILVMHQKGV
jgi:hypothetical protein